MATIRHHVHVDRTPDDVWQVVSDPASVTQWYPGIARSRVERGIRRSTLEGGSEILEKIVTVNHRLRRFQYHIAAGPLNPTTHLATIDVLPDGDGSLVIYSTDVRPDRLGHLVDQSVAAALAGLRLHLEDQS